MVMMTVWTGIDWTIQTITGDKLHKRNQFSLTTNYSLRVPSRLPLVEGLRRNCLHIEEFRVENISLTPGQIILGQTEIRNEVSMKQHLLVTAVGEDRPGIVSHLAEVFARHGANMEDSRMTVLGGEFAAIALVSVPGDKLSEFYKDLESLEKEAITVSTRKTQPAKPDRFKDYSTYQIDLTGADHEGIVHKVSSYLKTHSINIESMETDIVPAPETGTPLFCLSAVVAAPPSVSEQKLRSDLNKLGEEEAVEIDVAAFKTAAVELTV